MLKYKVIAKSTSILQKEVEARSHEEAKKIANELDGGDFINTGHGDWEITHVECIS